MSLIEEDRFRRGLLDYYRQRGGNFPIFRGAESQYGHGLGDILRAIGRFVLPIFAPAASKFISSAASGLSEGRNLKDAAKDAISPAIGEAFNATGSQIMNRIAGRGRKRKVNSKTSRGSQVKKVYKGPTPKRKSNFTNEILNSKLPRFLPTNF